MRSFANFCRILCVFALVSSSLCADEAKERTWWVAKVVKKLRGNQGIQTTQELNEWASLTDEQIVDNLLASPKFQDSLLDFFFYYLGFKADSLGFPARTGPDRKDTQSFFDFTVPFRGVLAWKENTDPFTVFTSKADIQIRRFFLRASKYSNGKYVYLSPEESVALRKPHILKMKTLFENLSGKFDADPKPLLKSYCEPYNKIANMIHYDNDTYTNFNLISALPKSLRRTFTTGLTFSCFDNPKEDQIFTNEEKEIVKDIFREFKDIVTYLAIISDDSYYATAFNELKFEKPTHPQSEKQLDQWGWFWDHVPNSSTNYSRKRSAYFFQRFFCDDLTPLNLDSVTQHSENKHASDPKCQSCHFKLDPMGGFFRYIDGRGNEDKNRSEILFSDFAEKKFIDYAKEWMTGDPNRPWNAGYIRSLKFSQNNDYGNNPADPTFDDLMVILKRAPEVKACFVRRAVEYMWGEDHVIDGSYLEDLTAKYNESVTSQPKNALTSVFKTLALSNTFKTPFSDTSTCYDFGRSGTSSQRPPCEIAFVIEKNCKSCHSNARDPKSLDVTRWVETSPGQFGFPHLDTNRQQFDPRATFQMMADRLIDSDPNRRMPKKKYISDQDRDAIYRWLQTKIKE